MFYYKITKQIIEANTVVARNLSVCPQILGLKLYRCLLGISCTLQINIETNRCFHVVVKLMYYFKGPVLARKFVHTLLQLLSIPGFLFDPGAYV
jgi:hypothetical protein